MPHCGLRSTYSVRSQRHNLNPRVSTGRKGAGWSFRLESRMENTIALYGGDVFSLSNAGTREVEHEANSLTVRARPEKLSPLI